MAADLRHVWVLPVIALLSGCAHGVEPLSLEMLGRDGYTLSAAEMHWNCPALENAVQARVTRIAVLSQQAKAEQAAMPTTLSRFFTRLSGERDSPMLTQITTERAAADAYNRELKTKGCSPVDLDAKLASVAPAPAVVAAAPAPALPLPSVGGKR